jgi:hypothetical protein
LSRAAFWRKYPEGRTNCSSLSNGVRRSPAMFNSPSRRRFRSACSTFFQLVF